MIKIVMFVHRKAGLEFEPFRDHYENTHVPLALSKFSFLRRYVRNYLPPKKGQPTPVCDCITELWFDDMESLGKQMAAVQGDAELEADELLFMNRVATRSHIVDEQETRIA